ncbi:putative SnoaL-like aldol condensation-catalyzing enzyme [Amycolatopsis lexingtonensis]|uniref:SnoaL-like aldol condensation-catalyzing enzyme n=1 Tax=Amycolatopsis lexingtonensis TaxID=218822 RepID=A0ABR9IH29_9PSEU|nr:ester cyclase [Amycolatopsis lexingtonensis]MBE1502506.1 putative SnoaL-like aldol condensation-catalyzing enzyme [Amycolatopsis lexingtonensis]
MDAAEVHRRLVALTPFTAESVAEGLRYIDPDVVDHRGGAGGDHHGIDAWRAKWEAMLDGGIFAGFRDIGVRVEQNVADGEFSVNRYTSTRTEIASGRRYAVTSMDMIRIRDGRVVEHWALMDVTARAAQLAPGGTSS